MPTGPSVMVMPGPGKPFEIFVADDGLCRQWAQQQIGGVSPSETANQNLANGAILGTLLGAGVGAAIGAATGGAGRVTETAQLWLVHCATRRAMLIDDNCAEYVQLAGIEPHAANAAYFQFLTLQWESVDIALLPKQHQRLVSAPAAARPALLSTIDDPLARLLDASLLVMRQEADTSTLDLATAAASDQGWRQPLLTYLKLQHKQATARGNASEIARLALRIQLVEHSLIKQP